MSYILDALRRAEAERERGAVPGLHSQPRATPPSARESGRPALPAGVWLAGGLALGLTVAGLAGWWLSGRFAAAPAKGPAQASVPVTTAAPDGVAHLPAMVSAAPTEAGRSPSPRADMADVPPPLQDGPNDVPQRDQVPPRSAATAAVRVTPVTASPPSAPGSLLPRMDTAATGAEGPAAAPASVERGSKRLSAADRKRLPKLALGGSMYSEDRASRMLVINDQVVREGDRVAPGVILERIGPHAAELSFEGKRFELPY
jgi:general secretion pathway protein B